MLNHPYTKSYGKLRWTPVHIEAQVIYVPEMWQILVYLVNSQFLGTHMQ
jgi:hypothetical protein